MIRKVKISMKVKLLSVMIFVLLTSLGTYLFFALDMFSNDKTAYIFETGLGTTESLADQIYNSVEQVSKSSFALALLYEKEPLKVQSLMDLDPNFLFFAVYKDGEDSAQEIARFVNSNTQETYSINPQNLKNIPSSEIFLFDKLGQKPLVIYNVSKVLKIPSFATLIHNTNLNEYYLAVTGMNKLSEVFSKDQIYTNSLIDMNSGVYFKGKGNKGLSLMREGYIKKIMKSKIQQGTNQYTTSKGEERLVAYTKLKDLGLVVISEIAREKAFRATKSLIYKSVQFGIMLVALAIMIGVVLSISITNPIKKLFQGTQQVAQGDFQKRIDVNTNDELGALSDSFNLMSDEISRLMDQTAQQARMEKELETAKTVQETLFPEVDKVIDNVTISGHYQPASECGGDWWYYSDVGDKIFFWIGDATGHGVPAALITSAACSAARIIQTIPEVPPSHAMYLLNEAICETSKGKMLMTFFMASYDKKSGMLSYSNASHNPPFLFPYGQEGLKVKNMVMLDEVNGPRLGQERGAQFKDHQVQINPNDAILFYTDGVTELEKEDGTQWGERKFIKSIIKASQATPETREAVNIILEDIESYRNGAELQDDVTFFLTKMA